MESAMDKPTYGMIMGILGAISCIGHGLIALTMQKYPELKKNKDRRFLQHLAVSDVLIAFHAFLSTAAGFSPKWPFGDFICQLDAFIGMTATFVSVALASWIAKMRCSQVFTPTKYVNVKYQVTLEWIFALIGGLMPFIGFGEYGYETDKMEFRTGCLLTFKNVGVRYWIYIVFITMMWFVWPLGTIIKSYRKLSASNPTASVLQFAVPLQIIISLTPYAVFAFATIIYKVSLLSGFYVAINNIFAKIMIASNPFLYILSDPEFNKPCKSLCPFSKVAEKVNVENKSE